VCCEQSYEQGVNMTENDAVELILDQMDENNIDSVLTTYYQIHSIKKAVDEKESMLKDKLRALLKENKWKHYKEPSNKISVTMSTQQREKVNKESLKLLLNDEQYNQVVTKTSFEKMLIITPEDRQRLKKYGRN